MPKETITVALLGSPSAGKTAIFNGLTGLNQYTASWPGSAIRVAAGKFHYMERHYILISLPDINAGSEQDNLVLSGLCGGRADAVLLVCDADRPEQGLQLLSRIISLEPVMHASLPLVFCINHSDEAGRKGISLDSDLLEDVLQMPVVPCSGYDADSLDDVKAALALALKRLDHYHLPDFSPQKLAREATVHAVRPQPEEKKAAPPAALLFFRCALITVFFGFAFWLAIAGTSRPLALLWQVLFSIEERAAGLLTFPAAFAWAADLLIYGIYRSLALTIAVTLPLMAILFPLFTLLGKLDYPEYSFASCRSHFPALLILTVLFFAARQTGVFCAFTAALEVTLVVLVALGIRFLFTGLLSALLSGPLPEKIPAALRFQLPPDHSLPVQTAGARSIAVQTLTALGQTGAAAVLAGGLVWFLARINWGGSDLLSGLISVLESPARLIGLDGAILTALILGLGGFWLGLPGPSLALPIILMIYFGTGATSAMNSPSALPQMFAAQGWTLKTALCLMCLTIKKEAGPANGNALSFVLAVLSGICCCLFINGAANLLLR